MSMPSEPTVVSSPCIGVCVLDAETGYCRGCLRTGDEIAAWPAADSESRLAILHLVQRRRRDGAVTDSPPPRRRRG